ncbi:MAG: hypothetical protein HC817_02190 [Saprospiraceae bacterium]|nr:hypothetical protein [Saprospiraceae bacterium]
MTACSKDAAQLTPTNLSNNPLTSAMDNAVNTAYLKYKNDLNTVGVSIGIYKNGVTSFYGYGETYVGSGVAPKSNTFLKSALSPKHLRA